MPPLNTSTADNLSYSQPSPSSHAIDSLPIAVSAVSWGAILAGSAAASALSIILLMLGAGLGLSSVSPWAYSGVSNMTFGLSTILWLTITQILASGMGGYLAGRLRTKWVAVHTDEVFFRDTAHGFLAWAVASLVTATILTSSIGSIVNTGMQVGNNFTNKQVGSALAGVQVIKSDSDIGPTGYFMDLLFRKNITASALANIDPVLKDNTELNTVSLLAEVDRIFMNAIRVGSFSAEDILYVSQIVAHQTGITEQDANQRVIDTYVNLQIKQSNAANAAKELAEKSRKASAYLTLWFFISLLIGAFVASLAATYGGRQRDL